MSDSDPAPRTAPPQPSRKPAPPAETVNETVRNAFAVVANATLAALALICAGVALASGAGDRGVILAAGLAGLALFFASRGWRALRRLRAARTKAK